VNFGLRTNRVFEYTIFMKKSILILAVCLISLCGCRIKDERKFTIKVPQMQSVEDVAKVRQSLMLLKGVDVKDAVFDTSTQSVVLQFDSMIVAHKNIEIAIAEAGYDANGISALK